MSNEIDMNMVATSSLTGYYVEASTHRDCLKTIARMIKTKAIPSTIGTITFRLYKDEQFSPAVEAMFYVENENYDN